uniref:Cytochrome c oxidase subunit 3 n=1 Tax=Perumytilus purpuratus TaxID=390823 RepID=A0A346KL04_PERPP|nr:cytochrome c oxidase subunit III [Perumytilus purpuratus]
MVRSPYYRVNPSPWPFMVSVSLLNSAFCLVGWMHRDMYCGSLIFISLFCLVSCMFMWWRDLLREGDRGYFSSYVIKGFRDGMVMFIVSEVMFFVSFFWAFFHSSLSPNVEVGGNWPPCGVRVPGAMIASLNLWLLVTSGETLNYSYQSLKSKDYDYGSLFMLIVTIFLGISFLWVQYHEYAVNSFCISDGIYGSVFYLLTGFHGVHVIGGTLFLIVTAIRLWFGHFTSDSCFGFTACVWYWHFVDVVWMAVFLFVYFWGNGVLTNLLY